MKFLLFLMFPLVSLGQDQWKNVYTESAWAERDQWQKAEEIIRLLSLRPGSRAADLGCHEGYLTFKLSKSVGPTGKVFAIDLDQVKLDKLKAHATQQKIENIIAIKGTEDDPQFPEKNLDAVVILDTYHEMDHHDNILEQILGSLKPGGRLVICEPIAEDRRQLSRAEQERKHELGMNYAIEDLQKAGFQILFKKDRFINREKIKGDFMWIIAATKK